MKRVRWKRKIDVNALLLEKIIGAEKDHKPYNTDEEIESRAKRRKGNI